MIALRTTLAALLTALILVMAAAAAAQDGAEEVGSGIQEGDVITLDSIEALKAYLPAEFWANRDFFFYEGMQLAIGPFYQDYSPPKEYLDATERFRGQVKIGPDGSLEDYTAGYPFEPSEIDCTGDPQAGMKIIWDFDYQWEGDGSDASFYYSYWDRGEELPLYFEGKGRTVVLSHRVEAQYLDKNQGDIFRGEKRKNAFGVEVTAPFDARGITLMSYRYKSADMPRVDAKNDDTWVYVPTLRRVRRISTAQRTDSISGTDFTFDDLRSFFGVPPQYEWECLGEMDIIAPMNTDQKGYPYEKDHNFGPYGLSFATDTWEMRHVWKIRFTPKNADHPYHHKDIYVDKNTLTPLYSFAYDRKEELWKIIWHNHRWSGKDLSGKDWYVGWKGVEDPQDNRVVADIIANVQTGTGNRIEFWDNHGMPFKSKGKIRRYIDVGRLTKGR